MIEKEIWFSGKSEVSRGQMDLKEILDLERSRRGIPVNQIRESISTLRDLPKMPSL